MIKGMIRAGEDMKPGTKARGRGRNQDLPDRAARGRGTRRRSWPIRGRPGGHRDGDWCPFHGARLVGESAGLRRAGRGGGPGPKPRRQRGPRPLAHRSFASCATTAMRCISLRTPRPSHSPLAQGLRTEPKGRGRWRHWENRGSGGSGPLLGGAPAVSAGVRIRTQVCFDSRARAVLNNSKPVNTDPTHARPETTRKESFRVVLPKDSKRRRIEITARDRGRIKIVLLI